MSSPRPPVSLQEEAGAATRQNSEAGTATRQNSFVGASPAASRPTAVYDLAGDGPLQTPGALQTPVVLPATPLAGKDTNPLRVSTDSVSERQQSVEAKREEIPRRPRKQNGEAMKGEENGGKRPAAMPFAFGALGQVANFTQPGPDKRQDVSPFSGMPAPLASDSRSFDSRSPGRKLYDLLNGTFLASCKNDSEAVHSELEKYVAGNAGFEVNHEANLQQLNLYLASELTEMKCELDDKAKRAAAKPLKEDELYQLRKKAYDDMWAYHQELNNRIEAGLVGRVLHGYGLRAMSEKDLLVSSELTFTLIFQLKRLQGMYIEDGLLVESVNEELANANVARGLALAAKAAHSQKTKAIASFFLGALGAMVIAVAIASVVVLATNPATASVMLPVAFFLFKFQVEAAVVSGLYLLAEFAYAVKKKFYNKEAVLPESTAGKVVLATGVNATALAMAAPAVTGACLVNPATFALSSGVAELATGNATVATATAAAPVAAGLAMIPAAFAAGTAMITRALLSTKRAYYGEGDTLREHAERAFELGKKKKETAQGGLRDPLLPPRGSAHSEGASHNLRRSRVGDALPHAGGGSVNGGSDSGGAKKVTSSHDATDTPDPAALRKNSIFKGEDDAQSRAARFCADIAAGCKSLASRMPGRGRTS